MMDTQELDESAEFCSAGSTTSLGVQDHLHQTGLNTKEAMWTIGRSAEPFSDSDN
jgi:hypothetical protein